jgi:hypothetical protein
MSEQESGTELKFAVDKMTESEIRTRLEPLAERASIKSIINSASGRARDPQGMEPWTYFIVALGAHVAADQINDLIGAIKHRFADKKIREVGNSK